MSPAIPAATLILLRDRPGAEPEIPMVIRGAHLAFAANLTVFPGGRVDEDDRLIATRPELLVKGPEIDIDDLAHRITAVRETIEEIGLAPCVEGLDDCETLAAIRTGLHAGEALSAMLQHKGLRIDPHAIHPFARWLPEREVARRFDTRFYIARAPELGEAVADGTESSHCIWGSARDHLTTGKMIFPTRRNLERIGVAADFDGAVAFTRSYPVPTITPWEEQRDGSTWLHIPDDLGYPVTSQLTKEVDRDFGRSKPSSTRTPG